MAKQEILTFKVDASLREALEGIPNRSEFIRSALLAALANVCPLCKGSGIMTPNQRRHWEAFTASHNLRKCDNCNELHVVCQERPAPPVHAR